MQQSDLFTPSILSVSELTDEIKLLLEGHFPDIKVEGEISNASKSRSGHIYFTLKDEDAQLSCVIWRSTAERIGLELLDGQQVIAGGSIQVYPPHGKYQMIVRSVEQAGKGALQEAFEKLKARLKEEGLFDEKHKKPLPKLPERIGVITSATGAAFHDIRDTLQRRWPLATVVLHHASVQGLNAAPELVKAVRYFSEKKEADLLIIGRGGGSLEDLWPFNEEAVARALFDCPIPVISAVGHEVDFSISDFVADVRAATPTQAAILATPDINELRLFVDDLSTRQQSAVRDLIESSQERVRQLITSHALLAVRETVRNRRERISGLTERIRHRGAMLLVHKRERLTDMRYRLEAQNPDAPLEKGYVRVWQDEKWMRRPEHFSPAESFDLEWKKKRVKIETSNVKSEK